MKTKSVLHVIAGMDPKMGGVCKAVRMIISGLDSRTVNNEVVSLDLPDAAYLKFDSFSIHALGRGWSPWHYNKKLIPWLINNLSRFDVIILHGLWLYNGYALKKALNLLKREQLSVVPKKRKIPKFFVMPHGMLDPYFQRATDRRLKAIRNWAYWKIIENKIVNECDGILFTSERERELAGVTFRPYSAKNEIVVGLGVAQPPKSTIAMHHDFLRKCPEIKDQPYFLFLSRIHEKKGVDLLIKAYYEVTSSLMENQAECLTNKCVSGLRNNWPKLVIAGPGLDTSYGVEMRKIVAKSQLLQQLIFFPGMLQGNAKWGAFYGCEAFILPSHQENFGIAIVEALSCGKPVLISNQVNICSEILETQSGLVEQNTIKGVKALLESWKKMSDQDKHNMGQQALILFETQFLVNSASDRLLKALH